jgi:hypothetical protein
MMCSIVGVALTRKQKLWRWLGALTVVLVAITLWWKREPRYQGRPLSDWLTDLCAPGPTIMPKVSYFIPPPPFQVNTGTPQGAKAEEALREIGTNAFPTLLAMLRRTNSTVDLWVDTKLKKQPLVTTRFATADEANLLSLYALRILSTNALPALNDVTRSLVSTDWNVRKAYSDFAHLIIGEFIAPKPAWEFGHILATDPHGGSTRRWSAWRVSEEFRSYVLGIIHSMPLGSEDKGDWLCIVLCPTDGGRFDSITFSRPYSRAAGLRWEVQEDGKASNLLIRISPPYCHWPSAGTHVVQGVSSWDFSDSEFQATKPDIHVLVRSGKLALLLPRNRSEAQK